MSDCRICLCEHNPEIHRATLRVRSWLRRQLRKVLDPVKAGPPKPQQQPFQPNLNAIRELRSPSSRRKENRVRNKSEQR